MTSIRKIKLHNFKRFGDAEISFDDKVSLLIGDNESGKSSVLQAIDLVAGGSTSKVQTIGLESLFNASVVDGFLSGAKKIEDLPIMWVELFLPEQGNPDLNGKNHSEKSHACDGLRMICEPRDDLSAEIKDILAKADANFPFEFYGVKFLTFSGQSYTGYRKYLRHMLLDSSLINNEYATREYIKTVYRSHASEVEISQHQYEYRQRKEEFRDKHLNTLNDDIEDYQFSLRTNAKSNLETDLTITEGGIPLEDRGKGQQCLVKTEFALRKKAEKTSIDVLLLEEPENHLSHGSMKRLISNISAATDSQIILSTHNSLICSRLDLRHAILLNSNGDKPINLNALKPDTADFFMKAPDNNVLELILSKKILLVEGDAEFILIEAFFKSVTGTDLAASDVHVISADGKSFKRYLELASLLNIRAAVLTDNDKNGQSNCTDNYRDHVSPNAQIFFDPDDTRFTFEFCLYQDNTAVCDELFAEGRRTLTVQEYMLKNKTEAALQLLASKGESLIVPDYILRAIEWINL